MDIRMKSTQCTVCNRTRWFSYSTTDDLPIYAGAFICCLTVHTVWMDAMQNIRSTTTSPAPISHIREYHQGRKSIPERVETFISSLRRDRS